MIKNKLRMRRVMLLCAVSLFVGIVSWRLYGASQQASFIIQPMAVTTVVASHVQKENVLRLNGTVEGATSAIVSSRLPGKIEQVWVEDGQAVQKDAVLLTLDTVELANGVRIAQNNVRQTEANLHTAQADFQRYQNLLAKNAVTKQQVESAEARLITSRAEVENAYANLDNAYKQIIDGNIKSPVTGVVANKAVSIGQVVAPGATLLSVEEIDSVYVVVNVEQKNIAAMKTGTEAEVLVDAYPGRVFRGSVKIINPVAGNENRMFRVKIQVDNQEQLLKPGMFAQTRLFLGAPMPVVAVPRSAVIVQKGLHYVYVSKEESAKKTLVQIGDLIGDLVEIKEGLSVGQAVVIDNLDKLKDGDALSTGKGSGR